MKKIMFIMPLMAISLLASCNNGGKSNTYTVTFNCSNCKVFDENDKEIKQVQISVSSQYTPYYKFHFKGEGLYKSPLKSLINVKKTDSEEAVDFSYDLSKYEMTVPVNSNLTITASGGYKTLEEYSWDEINEISMSGKAEEFFDIYDPTKPDLNCKEVYLKGQDFPHIVRIIDFNHDTDANGNPIGITFEFANVITEGTTEPTYALTTVWDGVFEQSGDNYDYRQSVLNDVLNKEDDDNSVINRLPEELSQVIKPANKLVAVNEDEIARHENYQPTSFEAGKYPKLFPLAHDEMTKTEYPYVIPGEAGEKGTYRFYKEYDDNKYRIKKQAGSLSDIGDYYWSRSPTCAFEGDNSASSIINISGDPNLTSTIYLVEYCVAPAFCI